MIKQFMDEPVTTWEPDELVVVTTDVPPACASCEKLPQADCPNPACAFRDTTSTRSAVKCIDGRGYEGSRMHREALPSGLALSRYFVSMYTDGPSARWNVIDRQTQEWVRRFPTKEAAEEYAANLETGR